MRMPWNPDGKDQQLPKKLRVGIVWDDGVVQPHPPVMRALKTAVEALKSAGHEVLDWDTSLHLEIQSTLWQMFFLDGAKEVVDVFESGNEGPVECINWALQGGPFETPRSYTVEETWKVRQYPYKVELLSNNYRSTLVVTNSKQSTLRCGTKQVSTSFCHPQIQQPQLRMTKPNGMATQEYGTTLTIQQ